MGLLSAQKKSNKITEIEAVNTTATAKEIDKQRVGKNRIKKAKKEKLARRRKVPRSVQATIPYLSCCCNNIIEVEKFRYSKTFLFSDINYSSASQEEQERIFIAYCEFLNGYDTTTDIQITIHNNRINDKDFENKILLKKKNDKYDTYIEEYNCMLKDKLLLGQNGIQCKKYVTITVTAVDIKEAQQKFSTAELHLKLTFQKIGSAVTPLTSNERIRILTDIFRGVNTDIREISTSEMQRQAEKSLCCPDYFEFKRDYFMYNEKYARTMFLRQLPATLQTRVVASIVETNLNLMLSINIASVEPDKAIKKVKRQLTAMRSNKIAKEKKAAQHGVVSDVISDDLKRSLEEAEELLDDLQSKNQKMFLVNLTVMLIADSYEELETNTEKVAACFRKHICTVSKANFQQEEAMASVLPLGKCELDVRRTLTTESTAVFMPFHVRELTQDGGMYYGLNTLTNNILVFNRKSLINPNGFILGCPGSGKSFIAKREITNIFLATNEDIIIIDPEREYTKLAKALGGEIIYISENSESHINPLDIVITEAGDDDPVAAKYNFFLSFFETIMGKTGVSPEQKTIIDNCLHLVFADFFAGNTTKTPNLMDYYNVLATVDTPEARVLLTSMELYVKGSMKTFAHDTNVTMQNRLVVYDIKDLGKQLKPLGMMVVLENLWDKIVQNRAVGKNTRIYIDEIYLLFRNEESANFLYELYKRARKWGGIPTGITQNVEDLLRSDTARSMLSNTEFILILNQAASDREQLSRLLKIPESTMDYVTGSVAGSGLMYCGTNGTIPFKDDFPTNTQLYRLMTTKFGE